MARPRPHQASATRDGYAPAGGGRCSRTTLGPPTAPPTDAGCNEDLGTLGAGAVSRSGTLAAGCVSLRKGDAQSLHYARRFSLRVSAASTATFTASSWADVFIYVLSGSDTSVAVVDSDDDSGTGTDATVTDVALAAGTTYTIDVTTSTAGVTGAFTLTGTIALDEPPVVITDLRDGTGYGLAGATVTAEDEFTVEPADATCTATTMTVGVTPAVTAGTAADKRKVTLALAAPFSHEVTVSCDAPNRSAADAEATLSGKVVISSVTVTAGAITKTVAIDVDCAAPSDPCDDPLGSITDDSTTRTGTIIADASCTSSQRRPSSTGTYYARRHTFTLDAAATVAVDLGSASSNSSRLNTYLLLLGGHNVGTGTVEGRDDAAGPSTDSRLRNVRLAAGDYTIEATTFRVEATGSYDLTVNAAFNPAVKSVTMASHGACDPDPDAPPQGIDAALECELVKCGTTAVAATAVANHATIGLAWAATGSASVTAAATPAATAILGPDNAATGDWQTTATAGLSCTADGIVTLTATAGPSGSADTHTTRLVIACRQRVDITGLADTAEAGAGTVTVTDTDTFTVSPAAAECTAAPVGAVAASTGGAAGDRVLSVDLATPAVTTITVTCTNDGYADGVEDVVFTHAGAVTSLGVRAIEGGRCERTPITPPGVDVAYVCVMAPDRASRVAADASATASGLAVAWSVSGSVTMSGEEPGTVTPSFGPDGPLVYRTEQDLDLDLDLGRHPLRAGPALCVRHRRHGLALLDHHPGLDRGDLDPSACRVRLGVASPRSRRAAHRGPPRSRRRRHHRPGAARHRAGTHPHRLQRSPAARNARLRHPRRRTPPDERTAPTRSARPTAGKPS
ncbi:hypothetical protein [Candidatus Poriferisodalis sp.]|uniref:hypothetical protein n=1 Tax=Candidatus Poriferisodalis sp. TaxID=3101277 RepID=UPI003D13ED48